MTLTIHKSAPLQIGAQTCAFRLIIRRRIPLSNLSTVQPHKLAGMQKMNFDLNSDSNSAPFFHFPLLQKDVFSISFRCFQSRSCFLHQRPSKQSLRCVCRLATHLKPCCTLLCTQVSTRESIFFTSSLLLFLFFLLFPPSREDLEVSRLDHAVALHTTRPYLSVVYLHGAHL